MQSSTPLGVGVRRKAHPWVLSCGLLLGKGRCIGTECLSCRCSVSGVGLGAPGSLLGVSRGHADALPPIPGSPMRMAPCSCLPMSERVQVLEEPNLWDLPTGGANPRGMGTFLPLDLDCGSNTCWRVAVKLFFKTRITVRSVGFELSRWPSSRWVGLVQSVEGFRRKYTVAHSQEEAGILHPAVSGLWLQHQVFLGQPSRIGTLQLPDSHEPILRNKSVSPSTPDCCVFVQNPD